MIVLSDPMITGFLAASLIWFVVWLLTIDYFKSQENE